MVPSWKRARRAKVAELLEALVFDREGLPPPLPPGEGRGEEDRKREPVRCSGWTLTVCVLPVILDAVTSPELRSALLEHRTASQEQARRLERIAEGMGKKATGPDCLWAGGILGDAKRDTGSMQPGPLLDAALIGAIRKLGR